MVFYNRGIFMKNYCNIEKCDKIRYDKFDYGDMKEIMHRGNGGKI